MALSSYNELVKQVASLKSENCHLRRELQDNSSHLTKLENDASNMKDVLSHIQVMFGEHRDLMDEQQQLSEECGTETGVDVCNDEDAVMTCHTSLCDGSFDEDDICQGQAIASSLEEGETSMTESAEGQVADVFDLIHKLELERKQLLQELERDEQNRQWLYGQVKAISRGEVDGLQQSDKGSAQADITRHQSEGEAEKVQGSMLEKLGSVDQGKLRQEARLYRIQSIEAEMKSLQPSRSVKDAASLTVQANDVSKQPSRSVKDAASLTVQANDMCDIKLEQESSVGGPAAERTGAPRNSQNATMAAQTVEVRDGIAPGIPQSCNLQVMYHGAWPIEKGESSSSGPSFITPPTSQDLASVISFNSSHTNSSDSNGVAAAVSAATAAVATSQSVTAASATGEPVQQLGTKTEMVCTLLSLLGTHDKDDMSRTLYAMSQSQDSCIAMRQSGCLPLLIQLLHGSEKDSGLLWKTRGSKSARARAAAALHNIVHYHHDDKRGRREARTLRLLEQIRAYCDQQRGESEDDDEEAVVNSYTTELDQHPGVAVAALMRLSFDEDYRHAICTLGGLQAITELLEIDSRVASALSEYSVKLRKYSCMALTNLTFGDGKNKSLLCSMRGAMEALTHQLGSSNEDLVQSAASVLRNLSWRADQASKKVLKEIGAVTVLMRTAMSVQKETTLKSILSALWNLSSHCSENKAEICAVEGALQFLVSLLTYKSPTKTLAIVENGGGILRNISSHVAVREDYRQILRKHDCLKILLLHLRSPSLSVVSNACGTLWNLSARCEEDQNTLWEMGAVNMLRNLVHSRQKMISNGSSAALRNLLSSKSAKAGGNEKIAESLHVSLHVRKQRALEIELDSNLSETCENVESPRNSPTEILHRSESEPRRFVYGVNGAGVGVTSGGDRKDEVVRKTAVFQNVVSNADSDSIPGHVTTSFGQVVRAGSQDSVGSTHSDISHDRTRAHAMLAKSSRLLHKCQGGLERKDQGAFLHGGMPRPNKTHAATPDHRFQIGQNMLNSNGGLIVNNTPAHARQPNQAGLHISQHPQHGQTWQTLPKSRIIQYLHEVALYAGIEPSTSFHSSLTQSAPSHMFHYSHANSNQHDQKILTKSSSGHINFNTANVGSVSMDYNNHLSTTDEETDQPVNYSLKYQDVAYTERGSKHAPYNNLTPITNAVSFRSGTSGEHVRSSMVSMNKNNHLYSLNTSSVRDKVPANNRKTTKISGNNRINPSAITENRPFLGYNRFHTPHDCSSAGPSLHQPRFITPLGSYPAASPFHSSVYLSSPGHPLRAPNANLPPRSAAAGTGFAPAGNTFTTSIDQFDPHHQSAHQNLRSLRQFSTYAETDLDVVVDQPTDFSLRYSEVSEESCNEDYQEQPINYSLQFRDSRGGDSQEMVVYGDERHCVECKYAEARRTNERIESSASDDQVQTFCTEGTPYLSTATSLTDLTQAGKHEGDPENEGSSHSGDGSVDKLDDDINESRAEVNKAAGSLCSHVSDRHSASTMVGILTCPPKSSSQISDAHRIQQNFHADCNEGSLDQTKTYCEEGTPVCFSRVSSLSSLHGTVPRDSDGGHAGQITSSEKVELACIVEAEAPQTVVMSSIQNKEGGAVCQSSKFVSSLRRSNADHALKGDRESKTVTFHENNQVEETPLMFSRCSSPESLSSFDTQSVHSSVISEYSRRASEVVSPSEIPDSPSESMPPSPKRAHSPTRKFKDLLPNQKPGNAVSKLALDFDKNVRPGKAEFNGYTGFDDEDKPINFSLRNPEMALLRTFSGFDDDQPIDFSSVDREQEQTCLAFSKYQRNIQTASSIADSHLMNRTLTPQAPAVPALVEHSAETESLSGKSEVPVVYADEGTPPNFSETTSLSGITMASSSNREAGQEQPNLQAKSEELDTESKSETVHSADQMLPQSVVRDSTQNGVLSLAKEQLKQEEKDASISDVSEGEEGILAECISSGMPTPVSSARKARRTSSDSARKKSGIPTKTSTPSHSKHTPKLHKQIQKKDPPQAKPTADDARSDTSSVENEDLLLSRMIQSAMPKSTPGRKSSSSVSHGESADESSKPSSRDVRTPFVPRASSVTIVAPFTDFIPTDTVRVYNVEDTPGNFSSTTSLSDLTIESEGSKSGSAGLYASPKSGKGLGNPGSNNRIMKSTPTKLPRMPGTVANKGLLKGTINNKVSSPLPVSRDGRKTLTNSTAKDEVVYVTFSPPSNDTLHTYNVEGTPITFSRNDSLSSLCDKDSRGTGSGISASPHKDRRSADRYESDSSSSIPKERHVVGQSSEDSSVAGDKADRPIKFTVEDTPVCFSRNSSLSSLNSIDKIEQPDSLSTEASTNKELSGAGVKPDRQQRESVNSLSDELADCDTTPSEQALLDQCISSAMPKSRLPKGEDKTRRHSKAKFIAQKGREGDLYSNTSGHGLTKSASLEMEGGVGSVHNSRKSQSAFPYDQKSLMTRSCSDTRELELCCPAPHTSSSRRSRFSKWQGHQSEDSEGSNIVEICQDGHSSFTEDRTPKDIGQLASKAAKLSQSAKTSESAADKDRCVETANVSLVFNDYTSDTNSEMSVEKSFEPTPLSENIDQLVSYRGQPRILKPENSEFVKKKSNDESKGKSVKGRRKLLYFNKSNNVSSEVKANVKATPGSKKASVPAGIKGKASPGVSSPTSSPLVMMHKKPSSAKTSDARQNMHRAGSSKTSGPLPESVAAGTRSDEAHGKGGAYTKGSNDDNDGIRIAAGVQTISQVKVTNLAMEVHGINHAVSASSTKSSGQAIPQTSTTIPPFTDPSCRSPGLSRLPTAMPSGKTPSTGASYKISKTVPATQAPGHNSIISNAPRERSENKSGPSTSKIPNDSPTNQATANKGWSSGIPRKLSGPSTSPLMTAEPVRQPQTSNYSPGRHVLNGTGSKKQKANKAATQQRRDWSFDRSSLRGSPSSSSSSSTSSSRLPISLAKTLPASPKPSSLPPSGFKASTLPDSGLASSKSRSCTDQISRSITYDKISLELVGPETRSSVTHVSTTKREASSKIKPEVDTFESPESGVRKGKVIELCDGDDDDDLDDYIVHDAIISNSYTHTKANSCDLSDNSNSSVCQNLSFTYLDGVARVFNSSAASSANSLDRSTNTLTQTDSSSSRREKHSPNILNFYSPSLADTTLQSTNLLDDSSTTLQANNSFVSGSKEKVNIENNANIIELHQDMSSSKIENKNKHKNEKAAGKTKSTVAQGLKKLFSGRHKDKSTKIKSASKESGKSKHLDKESKTKHSKSDNKDKKNGKDKKEKDFFQPNVKIEPSTMWTEDDKLLCSQGTCTISAVKQTSQTVKSLTVTTNGQLVGSSQCSEHASKVHEGDSSNPASEKHMTKTEMLLARRHKTSLSSSLSEEVRGEGELTDTCMVTTV